MPLGALVVRKAVTDDPHESLSKAVRLMEQENVGAVVVVERERPVGIITDCDVALAVCLHGAKSFDAAQTRMTCPVDTIREEEGVYNATHKMLELAVRRARR